MAALPRKRVPNRPVFNKLKRHPKYQRSGLIALALSVAHNLCRSVWTTHAAFSNSPFCPTWLFTESGKRLALTRIRGYGGEHPHGHRWRTKYPIQNLFIRFTSPSPLSPKWGIRFYLVTFVKIGRDDVTATGAASLRARPATPHRHRPAKPGGRRSRPA